MSFTRTDNNNTLKSVNTDISKVNLASKSFVLNDTTNNSIQNLKTLKNEISSTDTIALDSLVNNNKLSNNIETEGIKNSANKQNVMENISSNSVFISDKMQQLLEKERQRMESDAAMQQVVYEQAQNQSGGGSSTTANTSASSNMSQNVAYDVSSNSIEGVGQYTPDGVAVHVNGDIVIRDADGMTGWWDRSGGIHWSDGSSGLLFENPMWKSKSSSSSSIGGRSDSSSIWKSESSSPSTGEHLYGSGLKSEVSTTMTKGHSDSSGLKSEITYASARGVSVNPKSE